jgi:phosphate transport system permease protein
MTRSETWQARRPPDLLTWLVWFGAIAFGLAMLSALGLWIAQAWPAISEYGQRLITGREWFYRNHSFGAAGMIYGSIVVSVLAMILATPIAFGAAIYISEYLPSSLRPWAKATVEFLAAVPSVVYGLLGVMLLRNWMADWFARFDAMSGDMLATAGVLLAVMILPTVTTFAEDSLRAVPSAQRLAARGLALNKAETIRLVVLPQAWPGMIGAALLGVGRALGETIAVFLVIGRLDNQFPERLFSPSVLIEPGQTLTSKLGGPETHISMGDPLHWGAMLSLGLILLAVSAIFVTTGTVLRRIRKKDS